MDRILQLLRKNLSISRYSRKGVYLCKIGAGKKGRPSNDPLDEVVYTLCMGDGREELDGQHCVGRGGSEGPIMMSYLGAKVTMRPWDPKSCIIAAGLCNSFVHWPIQPGGWVIVVDCSLSTLTHIADIIGANGRLVGVIDKNNPEQPTDLQRRWFFRRYKTAFLAIVDVKNATLQDYQCSLGLPRSSKRALYMGLHPRVGAGSQVRTLLNAPEPAPLFRRIFEFLEFNDLSRMESLIFCHCPPGIRAEGIRDIVVRHLDILRDWQSAPAVAALAAVGASVTPAERVAPGDIAVANTGAAAEAEQENASQQPKDEKPQAGEVEIPTVEAGPAAAQTKPVPPSPAQMPPPPPPSQPPPQPPSQPTATAAVAAAAATAPSAETTSATAFGRTPPSMPPPPPTAATAPPLAPPPAPSPGSMVTSGIPSAQEEAEQEEEGLASSSARRREPETSERVRCAPPHWILLGLPMDHVDTNTQATAASDKLVEIVDVMNRLSNGTQSGLMAKEQLILVPHFPNHALLLLKYAHHRAEGHVGSSKSSTRPKKESSSKEQKELKEQKLQQKQQQQLPPPPTHEAVPLPSFGAGKVVAATGRGRSSGSSSKPALAQTEEGPMSELDSSGRAAAAAKQSKTLVQQRQRQRPLGLPAPGYDGRQRAPAAPELSFGQQGSRPSAASNFAPPLPMPRATNRQASSGTQPGIPSSRILAGPMAPTVTAGLTGPAGQQAQPSGLWDTGALARPWQMEGSGMAPRTDHLNFSSSWGLMNGSGGLNFMMPPHHGMGPPPGLQAPQQEPAPPGMPFLPWADGTGTGRGMPPPPTLPPPGLRHGEV